MGWENIPRWGCSMAPPSVQSNMKGASPTCLLTATDLAAAYDGSDVALWLFSI